MGSTGWHAGGSRDEAVVVKGVVGTMAGEGVGSRGWGCMVVKGWWGQGLGRGGVKAVGIMGVKGYGGRGRGGGGQGEGWWGLLVIEVWGGE